MKVQSNADRLLLRRELRKRLDDYYSSLSQLGMTNQQYDVLRGRIAEITDLIAYFELDEHD
ncbi:hypothetical protein [Gallibacterium sp. AGMB14963]|uniref:hypothetical protein n=1 Tax=Gallibacterium faecale TaxID=3019086 RepID=UPI0022F18DCC|nr:hypothetical protein [Gallibacterium sp. AGMB14963]MDA3978595.1 hypothetical protein [Gallibacterium sp. AGMB14963]